jgi:hypothetical protein
MYTKLKIVLSQDELSALYKACEVDLRNPADEIRAIVRDELRRRALEPDYIPTISADLKTEGQPND